MDSISARLDDESGRALARLQATGLTRSEAIRRSLIESAARLEWKHALADEVALLEADDADRAEMLEVSVLMGSLRTPR